MNLIACNHAGNRYIKNGALAFVRYGNPGSGHDRIPVIVRTRGGRWVSKWTRMDKLSNFRLKWVYESHPVWRYFPVSWESKNEQPWLLEELRHAHERVNA